MSVTGAIMAGVGAAGALGGAAISSSGANKAATTQSNAADYAASLQHQDAQAALAFQEQQYNQNQKNFAPWLQTGGGALESLGNLLGISPDKTLGAPSSTGGPTAAGGPGFNATGNQNLNMGSLLTRGGPNSDVVRPGQVFETGQTFGVTPRAPIRRAPGDSGPISTSGLPATATTPATHSADFGSLLKGWNTPFVPPTGATEQNDPGYAFRLAQGNQALENSAASRGGLLSTGTAKDLTKFGQDYASNEYGNVYNRALGEYQQQYNIFNNNQANQFNRLASLAGVGQTAAGQLSSSGQGAANNIGSILLNSGQQIGQNVNNAAAARASGYVGSANAYGGALSSSTGNIGQLLMLQKLFGGGGGLPIGDVNALSGT